MTVVEMHWHNDEVCEIRVNDTKVFEMTHDAHGWDGMAGIRDAVQAVTEASGGTVVVVGESGI